MEENKIENTEKKKFNKKFLAFGVLGILALMVVSALVVNYLSNPVSADVTVESPMELMIGTSYTSESVNNLALSSLSLGSLFSGGETNFYVSTHNKANVPVTGTTLNVVSNTLGITCADFSSITANVLNAEGIEIAPPATVACGQIDSTSVRLYTLPASYTWSANSYDVAHVNVHFANTIGTYTLSTQVVPSA